MRTLICFALGAAAVALTPAVVLAAEDAAAGQHLFAARCASCHGTKPGETKIGPTLAGVFGHESGSVAGFKYSPALEKALLTWDAATLDKWLQGPPRLVHGTTMFASVASAADRQNLIAYLKTLRSRKHRMVTLRINGSSHEVDADPQMPLLWAIRDIVGLTGTKFGCGIGACGACTVHMDGQAIRSCITAIGDASGHEIVTIEGLSSDGSHPVQRAWKAGNVPQCGYCQPGQIMQAAALLAETPKPSDQQIVDVMTGNICRCGTYQRIRDAIKSAAESAR